MPKARRKGSLAASAERPGARATGIAGDGADDHESSRSELGALHHRRGLIERLLDHATSLDESDAALVRSVYDNGLSATQLARALRQRPRMVRARVHRLIMRISSPAFQFVAREKDRWPPRRRQVAECIVLRARTQRQTARDLGISLHEVRKHLAHITALMDAP
jgi:DNA-directed RNA polymerase specialized sigma24 family protein